MNNFHGERLLVEQSRQADQYSFPYHHIPQVDEFGGLWRSRHWRYAWSYMAAAKLVAGVLNNHLCSPSGGGGIDTMRLADIGCGDGGGIAAMNGMLAVSDFSARWVGVDYDSRAIVWAKLLVPFASLKNIDVSELAKEGLHDALTCIEVLEHIEPDKVGQFVRAIASCVEQAGVVIFTVPSDRVAVTDKHFQHFSPEKLNDELTKYFSEVSVTGFAETPFWCTLLMRAVHNKYVRIDAPLVNKAIISRLARPSSPGAGDRLIAVCKRPRS